MDSLHTSSSSGSLLMRVAAVRHWFVFCLFCFCRFFSRCWSNISSPSLNLLEAGTKTASRVVFLSFSLSSFRLLVWLWALQMTDGWADSCPQLTLHSGRSYPGIPERPGSRTGTRPEREKPNNSAVKTAALLRSQKLKYLLRLLPLGQHWAEPLPRSAPWPASACAAFWQSGRYPPLLRSASSPGRYSGWWRHLSAPHRHYSRTGTEHHQAPPLQRGLCQHTFFLRLTCSEQRLAHPGQTAPWFCGLVRWNRWSPPQIWARPAPASRWTGTGAPFATGHPAGGRKEGNAKRDEVILLKILLKDGLLAVSTAKTISSSFSLMITAIWSWISGHAWLGAGTSACLLCLSAAQQAITSLLLCTAFQTPS